jgi:hypothetical protein
MAGIFTLPCFFLSFYSLVSNKTTLQTVAKSKNQEHGDNPREKKPTPGGEGGGCMELEELKKNMQTIPLGLLTLSLEHLLDTDRKMEVHSLFMKLRVRNERYCSG